LAAKQQTGSESFGYYKPITRAVSAQNKLARTVQQHNDRHPPAGRHPRMALMWTEMSEKQALHQNSAKLCAKRLSWSRPARKPTNMSGPALLGTSHTPLAVAHSNETHTPAWGWLRMISWRLNRTPRRAQSATPSKLLRCTCPAPKITLPLTEPGTLAPLPVCSPIPVRNAPCTAASQPPGAVPALHAPRFVLRSRWAGVPRNAPAHQRASAPNASLAMRQGLVCHLQHLSSA